MTGEEDRAPVQDQPTILESIARGDATAVRRCMDEYGGLVWSLANRYLRGYGEDVEDAVQDVFVELWRKADRYDRNQGTEPKFVATIAHRRLIDRQRRAAARGRFEKGYASQSDDLGIDRTRSDAKVGLSDQTGAAAKAIGALSGDEKQVLILSLGHGLTHERIAESTQLPLGTVKTRLRRALIRLREVLDAQSPSNPQAIAATKGGES